MTNGVIAALCLAGAVLLARPVPRGRWSARFAVPLVGCVVLLGAGVFATRVGAGGFLVPGLVLVGAALGGGMLRRQQRAIRVAAQTATRIQEVCEVLGSELTAGRPVDRCLDDAAELWPPLASIATTYRLGASVPAALRDLARTPGAADLTLVAAAWQVAHRTGAGLADSLTEVAGSLRERSATRRLVRSELSSARSTARLIAALPVLTLLLGSGTGGSPVTFLFTHPVGLGCLAGGVLLTLLGLWWIETIAGSVEAAT